MGRVAVFLIAAAVVVSVHAAEPTPAAAPANSSSSSQPQLRGSNGQAAPSPPIADAAATPSPTPPPSTAAGDEHAERVAQVLAATRAAVVKANTTAVRPGDGEVEAEWLDWGHGHDGETCCMCSYQYGGPSGTVVIYAAEDYDNGNFWGSHGAFWHCEHECERKCDIHSGGHKFGCLDEQHLRSLSRVIGRARGFQIEHQRRFGNLC